MKRLHQALIAGGLVIGLAGFAWGDDESSDLAIELRAPLDAVNCTAPQSVTILGQVIDIATADGGGGEAGDDSGDGGASNCAALTVGQLVQVEMASDVTPLTAAEISATAELGTEVKGPIQAIDPAAGTLTILGLTIDIGSAEVDGASNNGDDDSGNQPINVSDLAVGLSVEVKLDDTKLPALVATEVELKNFSNQVTLVIQDSDGIEIDDNDDSGNPVDDIDVSVNETVRVTVGGTRVKKVVQQHHVTNGSLVLKGLPTGSAKIVVTRNHNGIVSTRKVSTAIRPNIVRSVRAKLRKVS